MKETVVLSALLLLLFSAAFSQDPEFEYYKSKEIKTLLGHNRSGGGYSAFTVGSSYRFPTSFDTGRPEIQYSNIGSIKGISYLATFKFGKF